MKRTQKELLDAMDEVGMFHQESADITFLCGLIEDAKTEIRRLNTVEANLRGTIDALRDEIEELKLQIIL